MKYQLKTFADILSAVLEELKIQASDTTTVNRIKRDINIVYLNEVLPYDKWYFARKLIKLTQEKYYNTGTVSVTKDSPNVTLSTASASSLRGKLISTDSFAEVYKISSHSAAGTAIVLDSPYRGETNAAINFKVFSEGMSLPVDLIETCKVWHDHMNAPMEPVGDQNFLELMLNSPKREGYPRWYKVSDIDDPNPYEAISGLPVVSTRASTGKVREIIFGADVEDYLSQGDRVKISLSGDSSFDGEVVIDIVDGDTINYIGKDILDSSPTADLTMVIEKKTSPDTDKVHRLLQVYPALNTENCTINLEYMQEVDALENDNDQPIIPLQDRIVLMYGALMKAWTRVRNPEEAARNGQMFYQKLARMSAKVQDSTDLPQLGVDRFYLAGKRRPRRKYWSEF